MSQPDGWRLAIPGRLEMDPAAPNPSRGPVRVRFGLPKAEEVATPAVTAEGAAVAAAPVAPAEPEVIKKGKKEETEEKE